MARCAGQHWFMYDGSGKPLTAAQSSQVIELLFGDFGRLPDADAREVAEVVADLEVE